jgi:hypothetical protein
VVRQRTDKPARLDYRGFARPHRSAHPTTQEFRMQSTPNALRRLPPHAPHLVLAAPPPRAAGSASMVRHWDDLAAAVCERLDRLAAQSPDAVVCDGVRECVAALQQLHACIAAESSNSRRPCLPFSTRRSSDLAP